MEISKLMNEAKIVNYLFAGLLAATIVLFAWTCFYMTSTAAQSPGQSAVAAFSA